MRKIFLFVLLSLTIFVFAYNFYFANIHAHTSYSDGVGTPLEAFQHARRYVHVQAITDHAYYFEQKLNGLDKLLLTKEQAMKSTKAGEFVALWGFEWTGGVGHINVYCTDEWISRNQVDLKGLYKWIVEKRALAQFNHPISTFGTFNEFEYDPLVDDFMNLIEVGNGSWRGRTITDEMLSNYQLALKKGWHLGATANQDNHRAEWGSANDTRTVILAKELNFEAIMEALWSRRVYASEDKNAKLIFECNSHPMGSILFGEKSLNFKIVLKDTEPFDETRLISKHGVERVWKVNEKEFQIDLVLEPKEINEWYYVIAVQRDGDRIVSSPIWVKQSLVYVVNERTRVQGNTVGIFFDLVNFSNDASDVRLTVKVGGLEKNFEERITGKGKKNFAVDFSGLDVGKHSVTILVNDLVGWKSEVEIKGETVLIDISHENDHPQFLQTVKAHLERKGYQVVLNNRYFKRVPQAILVILPFPKKGAFAETSDLNDFEIDVLADYVSSGGKILLLALPNSFVPRGFEELCKRLVPNAKLIRENDRILFSYESQTSDSLQERGLIFLSIDSIEKILEKLEDTLE
ncbi:CehA/McbA family metallohydrolase [Pseudothermotoga sp.]